MNLPFCFKERGYTAHIFYNELSLKNNETFNILATTIFKNNLHEDYKKVDPKVVSEFCIYGPAVLVDMHKDLRLEDISLLIKDSSKRVGLFDLLEFQFIKKGCFENK